MNILLFLIGLALIGMLIKIDRSLKKIMGTQSEFDARVAAINSKLDTIGTQITDEAQQIRDFITANPGVDTSALDGVASRLDGLNVSGIFEPPSQEEPVE